MDAEVSSFEVEVGRSCLQGQMPTRMVHRSSVCAARATCTDRHFLPLPVSSPWKIFADVAVSPAGFRTSSLHFYISFIGMQRVVCWASTQERLVWFYLVNNAPSPCLLADFLTSNIFIEGGERPVTRHSTSHLALSRQSTPVADTNW